ncbi:MAG: AAA family ATPase [Streptosporangiaceae bacterium]
MAGTPAGEPDGAAPPAGARLFRAGTDDPGQREPAWLGGVRLRAARRVLWLRELWSHHRYEGEHLLTISHSEVDRALMPPGGLLAAEQAFYQADPAAAALSLAIDALAGAPPDHAWEHLRATLGPGPQDMHLLALSLAGAADPAMLRVFGYLLDAAEAAGPTPALSVALFSDPPFWCPRPDAALVRWRLARPLGDGRDPYTASTSWDADALLLAPLLRPGPEPAAADWSAGTLGAVVEPPGGPPLRSDCLGAIVAFLRSLPHGPEGLPIPVEIELVGPPGSGRTSLAAHVAAALGQPCRGLVAVDANAIAASPDPAASAVREIRRARLERRAVLWEHADALPATVWPALRGSPLTFLSTPGELTAPAGFSSVRRSWRVRPITRAERITLWSSLDPGPPPRPVTEWALRPAEVAVAARVAPAGDAAVLEVCRRLLLAGTPELLSPLPLPYGWDDLVISVRTERHLREVDAQARHRGEVLDDWGFSRLAAMGRGVTALFAGPSGTGKTMAAQVLAASLGLDLYRVDLAGVVSKYIGETEKHLREVFDACERAPVLLLFDEADALFGKRTEVSDAHDRYANIEVDYVLQRMEAFNGVAVLATNRKGDLDSAFVRRIQFIVDFAAPNAAERERLWRRALEGTAYPGGGPLVGSLDWASLGAEFGLTGAGIKSAALAAAFLARSDGTAIETRHVLAATRRELEKQGMVMRPGQGGLR